MDFGTFRWKRYSGVPDFAEAIARENHSTLRYKGEAQPLRAPLSRSADNRHSERQAVFPARSSGRGRRSDRLRARASSAVRESSGAPSRRAAFSSRRGRASIGTVQGIEGTRQQTHPVVVDSLNPSGGLQVVRMFFRSQSGPSWVNTTRAPFVECQILR